MDLVIVESPTKARTLARFLGSAYKIEASMGHIRDLPEKGGGLAIDVEHDFAPQYQVLSKKKVRVAELKKLAKNAETIYLATDPDREGEAIAFHLEYLLKGENQKSKAPNSKRFVRVAFHEITKTAIEAALKHPGTVDVRLVNAQQARRVLDRLVGYTLSPILWKKVRRGLSAGRVQSVAVRLIVDREHEIKSFVPQEYWEIFVSLRHHVSAQARQHEDIRGNVETWKRDDDLSVGLVKIDGKAATITDGEASARVVADLEQADYTVSDVTREEQKSSPNPPFTTSLLQRAASNLFGWSAKQTMQLAQSLYEHGLITYHRTDSYNLAAEAVAAAREYIATTYGADYVTAAARSYKTNAKSAQEAHEAIRPSDVQRTVADLTGADMTVRHHKLYELIRTRFLQCQMSDARFDKTSILVVARNTNARNTEYTLRADGKRVIFDGWMKLGKQADETFLPAMTAGDPLSLIKVDPVQKFTQPPARYSEAGLIKELEKRGIGRPSTYATILSTIQDRGYVVKEEKRLYPTAIGEAVVEFLVTNFPGEIAYEFTAKMEEELDEIAEGKREWVPVLREFWGPFSEKVKQVEGAGERVKVRVETTGEQCPECKEGEIVVRTGKYGKFLSCSRYPDCAYTKPYIEYVPNVLCPECGGRVRQMKSKKGAKFYGCENFPKCKWAAWKLPAKSDNQNTQSARDSDNQ